MSEEPRHQRMSVQFVEKLVKLKTLYYTSLSKKEQEVLDDRIQAFEKYKFNAVVTEKQRWMLSRCYDEQRLLKKLKPLGGKDEKNDKILSRVEGEGSSRN